MRGFRPPCQPQYLTVSCCRAVAGNADAFAEARAPNDASFAALRHWIERSDVNEVLDREISADANYALRTGRTRDALAAVKGYAFGPTIHDALIRAFAVTKRLADAEAVLAFVAKQRTAFVSAHSLRVIMVEVNYDHTSASTRSVNDERLTRIMRLYETAMKPDALKINRMAGTYTPQFAFCVLHAYAQLKDVNGIADAITYCRSHGIAVFSNLSGAHALETGTLAFVASGTRRRQRRRRR